MTGRQFSWAGDNIVPTIVQCAMSVVTYSYARQNLAKLMDEVERDHAPIYICRQRKRRAAVLVSEAQWSSMQETLYLLSNPKNAQILRDAIKEMDAGGGIERDLIPVKKTKSR